MGRKRRMGCRRDKKTNNTKAKAEPSSPNILEEEKFVPHIPDDIIVEILSGLPLNSLARLTCVSKQWRSMISDIFTTKTGRQMVVVISKFTNAVRSVNPESLDVSAVRIPWKKMNPSCRLVRVCGSCDGLLLMGVDDNLFLWNPLIGYWKKVLSYKRLKEHEGHIVSGFCYDSATNEYKVVMAFDDEYTMESAVAVVGSFSCKTWTSIPFPYDILEVNPGPVVNGYLHWCTNRRRTYRSPKQIIYFNPRMGEFDKIPMPQPKHVNGDVVVGVGALDKCLCMSRLNYPANDNDNTVEVLAMKEYGVEKTWTIMHVISNVICDPSGLLLPLCRAPNGEALIVIRMRSRYYADYDWNLKAYNPIYDSCKDIPIPAADNHYDVETVAYEESLVSPTGYGWEEEDGRGEATYVEHLERKFKRATDGHWHLDSGI